MDIVGLLDRARQGSRRDLARLLSLVEAGDDHDVREIVAATHAVLHDAAASASAQPPDGAHTIGVTGAPGVGKSTLTAALARAFREQGRTVAVLAVDPSSPFTGGALLGDRVRMAGVAVDEGVYIRSMASRGHLGGLSWATPPALAVLTAAGFDIILIETVGVGQGEVEVAALADTTLVVLAPGMGDAIQAAKAGILEVADIFVVNKADRDGAQRTVRELRGALDLAAPGSWPKPVEATSADRGTGVTAVVDSIADHWAWLADDERAVQARHRAAAAQVHEIVLADVRRQLQHPATAVMLDRLGQAVVDGLLDPYGAADRLLEELRLR